MNVHNLPCFNFDETGEGFGVASVLSTDVVFQLMAPNEGSSLVYQQAGTTYIIDLLLMSGQNLNIVWFIQVIYAPFQAFAMP